MDRMGLSFYRLERFFNARGRADAAASVYGDHSMPRCVSTTVMGVGMVVGTVGLFGRIPEALLAGTGVFVLGLVMAVAEAILDEMHANR